METGIYKLNVFEKSWKESAAGWIILAPGYYIIDRYGQPYFRRHWVTNISTGLVISLELHSDESVWKQISII